MLRGCLFHKKNPIFGLHLVFWGYRGPPLLLIGGPSLFAMSLILSSTSCWDMMQDGFPPPEPAVGQLWYITNTPGSYEYCHRYRITETNPLKFEIESQNIPLPPLDAGKKLFMIYAATSADLAEWLNHKKSPALP